MAKDFWKDLCETWREANLSDEEAEYLQRQFVHHKPLNDGLSSLSRVLWENFDTPVIERLHNSREGLKAQPDERIVRIYLSGAPMVESVWHIGKILRGKYPIPLFRGAIPVADRPEGLHPFVKWTRNQAFLMCLVASGIWPNGCVDDRAKQFQCLYWEFSCRFWNALFCRDEIARRVLKSNFQTWVLDSTFGKTPAASYGSYLAEAKRKIGAVEGGEKEEFVHNYVADAQGLLKNSPESETIRAALEQRFSEKAFFRDFLDHKKKAETRFSNQMESYRDEPGEDEQGRPLLQSPVDIIEVIESFAGVGQHTAKP